MTKEQQLFEHCAKFIRDNEISCGEAVYQVDRILENAPEFIEGVCDIVGYVELDDEED